MAKKIFSIFMIFCLTIVLVAPNTADAAPKIGDTKVETIYISNAELALHGGGAMALERLLKKKAKQVLIPGIGWAGAAAALAGYINNVSGNNGFYMRVTYRYQKHRVFDTYEWVEYTGWGIGSYSFGVY